jgi:DNA primase
MAFAAPHSAEAHVTAENALAEHAADFARVREDVTEIITLLRNRPHGTDPLAAIEDPQKKQLLASLFVSVHDAEPTAAEVETTVLTIRRIALEQQQRELRTAIAEAERAGRIEEALQQTREAQQIALRLRELA